MSKQSSQPGVSPEFAPNGAIDINTLRRSKLLSALENISIAKLSQQANQRALQNLHTLGASQLAVSNIDTQRIDNLIRELESESTGSHTFNPQIDAEIDGETYERPAPAQVPVAIAPAQPDSVQRTTETKSDEEIELASIRANLRSIYDETAS